MNKLSKDLLVEQLLTDGEIEKAERADRELPDHFSPLDHAETLEALGLNSALLQTPTDEGVADA